MVLTNYSRQHIQCLEWQDWEWLCDNANAPYKMSVVQRRWGLIKILQEAIYDREQINHLRCRGNWHACFSEISISMVPIWYTHIHSLRFTKACLLCLVYVLPDAIGTRPRDQRYNCVQQSKPVICSSINHQGEQIGTNNDYTQILKMHIYLMGERQ